MISLLVLTSTPLSEAAACLEVVAAIERLGQHDLGIVVARPQGNGLFQPLLRIVEPVGKQRDAAQLEGRRMVLGILGGYFRVELASFGKLPGLKQLIGCIVLRRLGLGCFS